MQHQWSLYFLIAFASPGKIGNKIKGACHAEVSEGFLRPCQAAIS
jgi:hypothetical protein